MEDTGQTAQADLGLHCPHMPADTCSHSAAHLIFKEYSKTCVRQPPLKLTLVVDVERWLSYKETCHVILLAKLHDMYLYKTDNFFHINHYLKSVSKVALLHRFYCMKKWTNNTLVTVRMHRLVETTWSKHRCLHTASFRPWINNECGCLYMINSQRGANYFFLKFAPYQKGDKTIQS